MYMVSKNLRPSQPTLGSTKRYTSSKLKCKPWKRKRSSKPNTCKGEGKKFSGINERKFQEKSCASSLEWNHTRKEQGTQGSRKNVPKNSKKQRTHVMCLSTVEDVLQVCSRIWGWISYRYVETKQVKKMRQWLTPRKTKLYRKGNFIVVYLSNEESYVSQ